MLSQILVYKNEDFVIVNKAAGIMSTSSADSVEGILKKKLDYFHFCQRLDTPVSGLLCLATQQNSVADLNAIFQQNIAVKHYLAICRKADIPTSATLENYLFRDGKARKARVASKDNPKAKLARLEYTLLGELDHYLVLNVALLTGRFHQIRAQLSHLGSPIQGDVKYGAKRGNKDRSISLHAHRLSFDWKGKTHVFKARPPRSSKWDAAWSLVKQETE